MFYLLFIILFLIIASPINADHLDAFLWIDNNWRDHRLKTDKNNDVYNMKQSDTVYYYYEAFLREPSCSINIQNINIDDPGVDNKKVIIMRMKFVLNLILIYIILKFMIRNQK